MKYLSKFILIAVVSFGVVGCASNKVPPEPANPGEQLVWSTSDNRPQWTYNDVSESNSKATVVGISDKYSTEKYAREDAKWDAKTKTVEYITTEVRSMIETTTTETDNASEIVDPQKVQKEYETGMSSGEIRRFSVNDIYMEKWKDSSGEIYWKAYVKTSISNQEVDKVLERITKSQ